MCSWHCCLHFGCSEGAAASKGLSSASIHFAAPTSSLRCLHYYYFVSLVPTLTIVSQVDRISWNHFMGLIMAMRFDGSDCRVPPPESSVIFIKIMLGFCPEMVLVPVSGSLLDTQGPIDCHLRLTA